MTFQTFQMSFDVVHREEEEFPCWRWKGPKTVHIEGKSLTPGRAAFYFNSIPLTHGQVLLQMCATPNCVRTEHHEACTRSQWAKATYDATLGKWRKEHPHG